MLSNGSKKSEMAISCQIWQHCLRNVTFWIFQYSGDPNTEHLNTGNIRKPDILEVGSYRTKYVRFSNGTISLDRFDLILPFACFVLGLLQTIWRFHFFFILDPETKIVSFFVFLFFRMAAPLPILLQSPYYLSIT